MSLIGTSRHSPRRNILDAIGGIADIGRYSWSFRRFSDGSFLGASAAWDGTGCKTAGQPQPAPLSTDCQFPACRSDDAFVGAPPAVRPQGAAHRKCFQASECRKRQFGGCFQASAMTMPMRSAVSAGASRSCSVSRSRRSSYFGSDNMTPSPPEQAVLATAAVRWGQRS